MREDLDHRQPPAEPAPPTPSDFDEGFAASAASDGLRRVWQAAEPDLPAEIEPFSYDFVRQARTARTSAGEPCGVRRPPVAAEDPPTQPSDVRPRQAACSLKTT